MATMMQSPQTETCFTEMPEVYTHGTAAIRSRRDGGRRTESPDRAWFGEGRKKGQSSNAPYGGGVQDENMPPGQRPMAGPQVSPAPQPSLPHGLKGGGATEPDAIREGTQWANWRLLFRAKVSRGVKSLVGMHKG